MQKLAPGPPPWTWGKRYAFAAKGGSTLTKNMEGAKGIGIFKKKLIREGKDAEVKKLLSRN